MRRRVRRLTANAVRNNEVHSRRRVHRRRRV